jgi:hypothetical protein
VPIELLSEEAPFPAPFFMELSAAVMANPAKDDYSHIMLKSLSPSFIIPIAFFRTLLPKT